MRLLFLVFLIITSCNSINKMNKQNIEINKLLPSGYEFIGQNGEKNKIDYYYLKGDLVYDTTQYLQIRDFIDSNVSEQDNYSTYSVYIYKESELINEGFEKDLKWLDGKNEDIISYVRFQDGQNDMFYILKKGKVVYDLILNEKQDFEFEQ